MQRKGRSRYNANPRRGEHHGGAKLTDANIKAIRTAYAARRPSLRELAVEYGVGSAAIFNILHSIHYRTASDRPASAKLTYNDAVAIRARYLVPPVLLDDLASQYGVTKTTICRIVNNRGWRHV